MASETCTLSGKIIFRGEAPDTLPEPSQLKVTFADVSLACAPSKKIAEVITKVEKYDKNTPLKYSLTFTKPKPEDRCVATAVSAVLNVGWIPDPNGQDWLRRGDWLNDTRHSVDGLMLDQKDYNVDVEVKFYDVQG